MFRFNLQFFAEGEEGEGVNESAAAEQTTDVSTGTEDAGEEGTNDPGEGAEGSEDTGESDGEVAAPQSSEDNAKYAAARRASEAQLQKVQQAQAQLDNQFAAMFGKYKNPVTGEPIRNANDYIAAMQAQERLQAQEKLKSAGVDPAVLDKAIANSPVVQNAQRMQEQFQAQQVQNMVQEDLKQIMLLDPTKQTQDAVVNDPSFGQAVEYVKAHPGVRLFEAYKLVNFDRLRSSNAAAAQQAAVNQAKSKSHLKSVTGSAGTDKEADIPAAELSRWQQMFPEKNAKELKATYNRSLRAHGK